MYVTPLEFQFCNSCRLPISGSFFLFFFFILSSYLLIIIPLPTPFPSVLYLLHFSTYFLLFQIISPLSSFSLHATFNPYHFLSFYIPSCQSFLLPLPFHSLRSSNTPPLFCTIFKLFFTSRFFVSFRSYSLPSTRRKRGCTGQLEKVKCVGECSSRSRTNR